jgi:hypothetical protein
MKGFEVLTEMGMKNAVLWDVESRSPLKVNRRFKGTPTATCYHTGSFLDLSFDHEGGGNMFLQNFEFQQTIWHCIPKDSTFQPMNTSDMASPSLVG